MKIILPILIIVLFVHYIAGAQGIQGKITDETGAPVPFANIFVSGLNTGTSTNVNGVYKLDLPKGSWQVSFRYLGFKTQTIPVTVQENTQELNVILKAQSYQIPEIKVLASGEDPAYYIIRRAIAMAPYFKKQVSKYSCKVYLKGSGVFVKIPKLMKLAMKKDGVDDVKENDPFVLETLSSVEFELPDVLKQKIIAMHSSGKQNNTNPMYFITNNLYDSEKYDVVSPVGTNALKTYHFKLAGVFEENGHLINKIQVIPKRETKDTFTGFIFIADRFWNIHSADLKLSVPMTEVTLHQLYSEVAKNAWMPVNMDFDMDFSGLGLKMKYKYVASMSDYKVTLNPSLDHSFLDIEGRKLQEEQQIADSIQGANESLVASQNKAKIEKLLQSENLNNRKTKKLNRLIKQSVEKEKAKESLEIKSEMIYDQKKTKNDSAYWAQMRPIPLTSGELKSFSKKDSFLVVSSKPAYQDSIKNVKRKFKAKHLIFGHTYNYSVDSLKKRETLRFPGLFNISGIGYNLVDGFTLPVAINYFKSDSTGRFWMIAPSVKYAFAREKLDTEIKFTHRFNGINKSRITLGAGSGIVDFNEKSGMSDAGNTLYTLYFERNFKKYYQRHYLHLGYARDLWNGLEAKTELLYRVSKPETNHASFKIYNFNDREFTPNLPDHEVFAWGDQPERKEATMQFSFNYTPRYRYRIKDRVKTYVESKYPTFNLVYKQAFGGLGDGKFSYLETGVRQNFDFGISDRFSYKVNAGAFLDNEWVFFENYRHFNTQPTDFVMGTTSDCFRLLPFYRYSTSKQFIEGHASWDSRKLLLKQLPVLGNSSITENLFVNYLSTPGLKNYCELGYGLRNVFLLLNLEAIVSFRAGKFDSAGIKLVLNVPE